jgi:hypothetical protein
VVHSDYEQRCFHCTPDRCPAVLAEGTRFKPKSDRTETILKTRGIRAALSNGRDNDERRLSVMASLAPFLTCGQAARFAN